LYEGVSVLLRNESKIFDGFTTIIFEHDYSIGLAIGGKGEDFSGFFGDDAAGAWGRGCF
jgi:hypothetical protein